MLATDVSPRESAISSKSAYVSGVRRAYTLILSDFGAEDFPFFIPDYCHISPYLTILVKNIPIWNNMIQFILFGGKIDHHSD